MAHHARAMPCRSMGMAWHGMAWPNSCIRSLPWETTLEIPQLVTIVIEKAQVQSGRWESGLAVAGALFECKGRWPLPIRSLGRVP